MKKSLLLLGVFLLSLNGNAFAQRLCGAELVRASLIAKDPAWKQRFEDQRNSLQGIADAYKKKAADDLKAGRTTSASAIPVIFHILITSGEYDTLGGTTGIVQR